MTESAHVVRLQPGRSLGGGVPEPHDALAVDEEDGVGDRREDARRLCLLLDLFVQALLVVDVGGGANPQVDAAGRAGDRNRSPELPAVRAVRAAVAELRLEDLAGRERARALLRHGLEVVRVDDHLPGVAAERVRIEPRVLVETLVAIGRPAERVGRPHDLRHRVRELAVALLAAATRRGQLGSPQQLRLALQLLGLLMQVDEHGDLRAQQLGVERLEM